jgi:periplasmic copper chaperone A
MGSPTTRRRRRNLLLNPIAALRAVGALAALALFALFALSVAAGETAFAHTETDLVAVPAGSEAVVSLRPTHGCGDAPTVSVRIRAPLEGAVADPVDGWQASASPDGAGNTVLEWSGGPLPADTAGSFPVRFTAPDAPGELLVFAAVQRCADGQELAWINGDPTAEYPAPRVLVLPAGSEPAATIDDVALDAPGRDQLVAVVDVDAPTTTTPPTTTAAPAPAAVATPTTAPASTTEPAGTAAPSPTSDVTSAPTTIGAVESGDGDEDDDDVPVLVVVAVIAALVGAATAVVFTFRRRR